jgi:hypothetical protein
MENDGFEEPAFPGFQAFAAGVRLFQCDLVLSNAIKRVPPASSE